MGINKKIREEIHNKYDGCCAYCGIQLKKGWHVDHINPLYRNDAVTTLEVWGVKRGTDDIDNLNPSCPRCNRWKSTFDVEGFRGQIEEQCNRLQRDSSNYRMALDYGMIVETEVKVTFFYEKYKKVIAN